MLWKAADNATWAGRRKTADSPEDRGACELRTMRVPVVAESSLAAFTSSGEGVSLLNNCWCCLFRGAWPTAAVCSYLCVLVWRSRAVC